MARETLKSFLNKLGVNKDKISYNVNPASGIPGDKDSLLERGISDLGIDPNTDLPLLDFKKNEGLLGDYLSEITSENVYNIKKGNSELSGYKRGNVLPSIESANEKFVEDSILNAQLASYSNSNNFVDLSKIVDKNSKNFNNHNILSDIPSGERDTLGNTLYSNTNNQNQILKQVGSNLEQQNTYHNNSIRSNLSFAGKEIQENEFETSSSKSGNISIQNKFGVNEKQLEYNLESLKNVGLSMLYKASGYDKGTKPGESINISDIESDPELKKTILDNKKFNKVDFESTRALNAESAPKNEAGEPYNHDPYLISLQPGKNSKTFGQTFNDSVNFYGKNKQVLMAKSIIACKALIEISKSFYDKIKSSIDMSVDEPNLEFANLVKNKSQIGPFYLGTSRGYMNASLDLLTKSMIVRTK